MTAASPARAPLRRAFRFVAGSRTLLWVAFILAHLWLGYVDLFAPSLPLGDVTLVYKYWAQEALQQHIVVGLDTAWVYPIVALVPILGSAIFGFAEYAGTWLSLVFVLDIVAFAAMVGWRRRQSSLAIGWWWVAFLLLLGPIALGRLDSITVPIAIVAVLLLARRPAVAAVLLAIAMWIKVWPAAILGAVIISSAARVRILIAVIASSAGIILLSTILGGGSHVFSFVSQQTTRGLQVEAPVSSIWMWLSFAGVPGDNVYYDEGLLTYQVAGPGTALAASVMTPLFILAVAVVAVFGILATRRRAAVTEVLPSLALAFVCAFIAFNKVGSPQYMTWIAVPVILGLATNATGHGRSFRTPAIMALVLAALTQLFYPYLYTTLLNLDPILISILTVRNILVFVLLAWSVVQLVEVSRRASPHEQLRGSEQWLPTFWPFGPVVTANDLADPNERVRDITDRGMVDDRFSPGE